MNKKLINWLGMTGIFALIVGMLCTSITAPTSKAEHTDIFTITEEKL